MLAYGIVDQPYARRAAAKKLAQEEVEPSSLSVLNKGESVWYFHAHGRISPATIKEVHYEDVVPYYSPPLPFLPRARVAGGTEGHRSKVGDSAAVQAIAQRSKLRAGGAAMRAPRRPV